MPDDRKQAIEQIKLRVPIEELVRERVAGLRKSGRLWTACCPFHEESTPSFKVDPSKGTWRCYGACAMGGDVISFLEKHDNLKFNEALDLLAARAGVELPRSTASRKPSGADDPLYAVLERALEFYKRMLHSSEGARALEYLRGRGLTATTIEAFGLGFSPAGGEVLAQKALAGGTSLDPMLATGLVRRNDQGRAYDFFRGRLMIPIRDERGRTVGFGARRLDDSDKQSPKYVNTTETEVFHKGRLIYALDQAQREVRSCGHMVLVEGYTDVMAAHQAGLRNVVAVLGTAMTDEHAALVRRSGAKRVTLCFDGDVAGRQATWRALNGLVALDIEIDVVRLTFDATQEPGETIKDPCDLLVRHGAAAFQEQLARAVGWFEFLMAQVEPLADRERLQAVDRVLELVARLAKPLQRDARLTEIAQRLGYSASAVREQFQTLPARMQVKAQERRRAESPAPSQAGATPKRGLTHRESMAARAWRELLGAVLQDGTLVAALEALASEGAHTCPDPELALLAAELRSLGRVEGRLPDLSGLLASMCEHPSRDLIVPLMQEAEAAESPSVLFEGARAHLERVRAEDLRAAKIADCKRLAAASPIQHKAQLDELHRELILEKFAPAHQVPGTPARS
ncbi:MAG TPA: DNA primase [Planctomycetota bacterium]|nr:DNA primase [Planctomycetota bacterium]